MKIKKIYRLMLSLLLITGFIGCSGGYTDNEYVESKPVTIETFMQPLSADGEWVKITREEIDANGIVQTETVYFDDDINTEYIWRPNRSNLYDGWTPYTNGRWVFTDSGWMWASNYNWGWAPYHYGRWWFSPAYGWVWSPGYRWAPAWVSWRYSDTHTGWYPLSPRAHWNGGNNNYNYVNENWTFVENKNFTKTVDNTTKVGAANNKEIINNTKESPGLKEQNNKIVNQGPDVNQIQKSTGKTVTPKTISETTTKGKPQVGKSNVTVFKGNTKSTVKTKSKTKGKTGNKDGNTNGNQDNKKK